MKKLLMFIPLVFLLCFTFSCQQGEEVAELEPLAAEDVAANRAVSDAFNQGARSGDRAAVAALYTEDAIIMPANQPLIKGREAIQAWHEASPAIEDFNLTIEDVFGRGDIAVVRGTYSMTIALEGAPEPIEDTGKYIEIRRKQEDGSWLIAIDIFNSDMPFPESPEME
jgi:uncharacterized protein (TIGR02246 family)